MVGDVDTISIVRSAFSVANPAFISKKPYISARLYVITPTGKFDSGLLDNVTSVLDAHSFSYKVDMLVKDYFALKFGDDKLIELSIPYRDFQSEAIRTAIAHRSGVILVGTGGGKTLLAGGLITNIRKHIGKPDAKVMVTVPTLQLVEQTSKDFEEYGLTDITKWSGKNKLDRDANIIIAGTQYLVGKNTDLSIMADIDIFIIDETHVLRRQNQLNKIFKFLDTPYKFGLTGTMPSEKIDQWNIIGKIGSVLFEKKTDELKNDDYVSNFHIYILNINHGRKVFTSDPDAPASKYLKELDFLINDTRRNDVITNLSLKLSTNTVIMVDRIINGDNILKKLQGKTDRPVYFIQGSTELEDRETIRKLMEERSDVIVIASTKIFSTGINIPNLHNIIFASAGKAKIKIIQSIGRALRLHPTKELARIFDISDNTHYANIHREERKKLYMKELYPYTEKNL